MSTDTATPVVELVGVTRRFGKNYAVRDASLAIHPGEVVGLVGDNGAGKSTIVKMISGYIEPTAGTIKVMGRPVRFGSPREARAAGIETVYQDLAIVDDMALWRNFFLGKELHRRTAGVRWLRVREMVETCDRHLREVGLTSVESSRQTASTLSGGERQSLAISRGDPLRLATPGAGRAPWRALVGAGDASGTGRHRSRQGAEAGSPVHRPQHGPRAARRRPDHHHAPGATISRVVQQGRTSLSTS